MKHRFIHVFLLTFLFSTQMVHAAASSKFDLIVKRWIAFAQESDPQERESNLAKLLGQYTFGFDSDTHRRFYNQIKHKPLDSVEDKRNFLIFYANTLLTEGVRKVGKPDPYLNYCSDYIRIFIELFSIDRLNLQVSKDVSEWELEQNLLFFIENIDDLIEGFISAHKKLLSIHHSQILQLKSQPKNIRELFNQLDRTYQLIRESSHFLRSLVYYYIENGFSYTSVLKEVTEFVSSAMGNYELYELILKSHKYPDKDINEGFVAFQTKLLNVYNMQRTLEYNLQKNEHIHPILLLSSVNSLRKINVAFTNKGGILKVEAKYLPQSSDIEEVTSETIEELYRDILQNSELMGPSLKASLFARTREMLIHLHAIPMNPALYEQVFEILDFWLLEFSNRGGDEDSKKRKSHMAFVLLKKIKSFLIKKMMQEFPQQEAQIKAEESEDIAKKATTKKKKKKKKKPVVALAQGSQISSLPMIVSSPLTPRVKSQEELRLEQEKKEKQRLEDLEIARKKIEFEAEERRLEEERREKQRQASLEGMERKKAEEAKKREILQLKKEQRIAAEAKKIEEARIRKAKEKEERIRAEQVRQEDARIEREKKKAITRQLQKEVRLQRQLEEARQKELEEIQIAERRADFKAKHAEIYGDVHPVVKELLHDFKFILVGGYIRDAFKGKKSNDYDLIFIGSESQLLSLMVKSLPNWRFVCRKSRFKPVYNVHLDGGITLGIVIRKSPFDFEKDALNRDAVLNAFYLTDEELLDPTGRAWDEINAPVGTPLGTVVPPLDLFKEDILRVLRMINLKENMGGVLSLETEDAIKEYRSKLTKIPLPVIFQYLKKIFENNKKEGFADIERLGVLNALFPNFNKTRFEREQFQREFLDNDQFVLTELNLAIAFLGHSIRHKIINQNYSLEEAVERTLNFYRRQSYTRNFLSQHFSLVLSSEEVYRVALMDHFRGFYQDITGQIPVKLSPSKEEFEDTKDKVGNDKKKEKEKEKEEADEVEVQEDFVVEEGSLEQEDLETLVRQLDDLEGVQRLSSGDEEDIALEPEEDLTLDNLTELDRRLLHEASDMPWTIQYLPTRLIPLAIFLILPQDYGS